MQPCLAGHIVGLLSRLSDDATDELPDPVRGQAGPVEDGLLGGAQQHSRMHSGQLPATTADRRPRGLDDDDVAHVHSLLPEY